MRVHTPSSHPALHDALWPRSFEKLPNAWSDYGSTAGHSVDGGETTPRVLPIPMSTIEPPQPLRFVVFWQFVSLTLLTSASDVIHTTVIKEFRDTFHVPAAHVNWLNAMYLSSYVIFGPLVTKAFSRYGLRRSMLAASVLNVAGCLLKVVGVVLCASPATLNVAWWLFVVGQFLISLGINFCMAGPTVMTTLWFPPEERATATNLAAQADSVGIALGAIYPPFLVAWLLPGRLDRQIQKKHTLVLSHTQRDEMRIALVWTFAVPLLLGVLDLLVNALCVKAHPAIVAMREVHGDGDGTEKAPLLYVETPEDVVLLAGTNEHSERDVRKTMRRDLIALTVGGALSVGVFWAHAPVFVEILLPFGYSETFGGVLSCAKIVLGVVPGLFLARWIDFHREYKGPLLLCVAGTMAAYAALAFGVLEASAESMSMAAVAGGVLVVLGACQNAIAGIVFEYLIEVAYPYVGEEVSAGWFMWMTHLFGTMALVCTPYVLDEGQERGDSLLYLKLLLGLSCISFLFVSATSRTYRRYAAEEAITHPLASSRRSSVSATANVSLVTNK
jgi:MFS family permease